MKRNVVYKKPGISLLSYDRFYILTAVAVFFKTIVYAAVSRMNFVQLLSSNTLNIIIAAAAAGILLPAAFLMAGRRKPVYLLILDIILTFVIIADTWYGRYYYAPVSISYLSSINMDMVGTSAGSVSTLFQISDLLYIIDLPVFIYLLIKRKGRKEIVPGAGKRALSFAAAALTAIVLIGGVMLNSETDLYAEDNNYVTRNLGLPLFHLYDAGRSIEKLLHKTEYNKDIENEIVTFFRDKSQRELSESGPVPAYQGAEQGKNLIVVQMEALQQFVIGLKIDGREVTPNLNRLLEDSIYFNNIYVQVGSGNTSDSEFLSNTSMYPARDGSAYARFNKNSYYSLAGMLKDKGYTANSFHANNPEFWSRIKMHKTLGFSRFYNKNDFVMDDLYGFDGTALSDVSFYRQSLDIIKVEPVQPNYNFLISVSSHHPFTFFKDYRDFDAGDFEGSTIGNYLKAQHYSDYALGSFIDNLKKDGLYDKSLLVVYGDHTAVIKNDMKKFLDLLGRPCNEASWMAEQKIPLIIKGTNTDKGIVNSTTGGHIDIYPTIANLLGIKNKYAFGRDLLNTKENFAIFRNGSFIKDNIYYMQSSDVVYDMTSGKMLEKREFSDLIKQIRYPLRINDLILEYDAFKYLKQ